MKKTSVFTKLQWIMLLLTAAFITVFIGETFAASYTAEGQNEFTGTTGSEQPELLAPDEITPLAGFSPPQTPAQPIDPAETPKTDDEDDLIAWITAMAACTYLLRYALFVKNRRRRR